MLNPGFNAESGIFYTRTSGSIGLEDMYAGIEMIKNADHFPRNLKILENSTETRVTFTVQELPVVVERLMILNEVYESIRHAVIHNDPVKTALALLIQKHHTLSNYELQVFATETAAIHWLNNG
jgi:hypothetical protein